MIKRIKSTRQEEVQLERLPIPYNHYKELFENGKAEMLVPRQTFDHAFNPRIIQKRSNARLGTDMPNVGIPITGIKQITS